MGHTAKFCVFPSTIVSPLIVQVVVVAVASNVSGFQDVVAVILTLRNSGGPMALFNWTVLPIVNRPAPDSGPSTGPPSTPINNCIIGMSNSD